jgi:hypothetical protein
MGVVLVVLITGFSGSVMGLGFGVVLVGGLAGFHIYKFLSSGLLCSPGADLVCSAQPVFTACYLHFLGTWRDEPNQWHVSSQILVFPRQIPELLDWRCFPGVACF